MSIKEPRCAFCGRPQSNVRKLISSPSGASYICDNCIDVCQGIIRDSDAIPDLFGRIEVPAPQEIKAELDKYIIGQEDAKRAMAVAVYNHYKRVNYSLSRAHRRNKVEIDKSNILLIGPTGVGKTLIAKTLAKMLKVPFVCVDATSLTEAGYVGDDVESILSKLLRNADGDVVRAETGIVYIDEIDKIARKKERNSASARDVSGEGVQQALLKILEGAEVQVPFGNRKFAGQDMETINTSNILFICGGAFVRLNDIISARKKKTTLGFVGESEVPIEPKHNYKFINKVRPDDLMSFGLIPEFIGRLPVVVGLQPLDREAMVNILSTPKNNLIEQYKTILKLDGVELEFTPSALSAIADKALLLNMGARGLRTIMEEVMLDIMYECPSKTNLVRVIVDEKCITEKTEPKLVYKKERNALHAN